MGGGDEPTVHRPARGGSPGRDAAFTAPDERGPIRPPRSPGGSTEGRDRRVITIRCAAGLGGVAAAFDLGASRLDALADRGARVERHRFEWTRRSAPPCDIRGRVILGGALPVDGRMPLAAYLDWVAVAAGSEGAVYLPHRRETARQRDAVARIPGVEVRVTGLPLEITLAGAADVDVLTLSSSAQTTLPLVLGERAAIRSAADRRAGEPA
ncbi:hypothetical protein GCM10027426_07200 [Microbacterium lacusdiani]